MNGTAEAPGIPDHGATFRRVSPLLKVLLGWTAIVAGVLLWLPLVRGATQGAGYQWALAEGIGGRGIGGSYWALVLGAALVIWLLDLGWQGGRSPFHALLLAFHLALASAAAIAVWSDPSGLRFQGATMGVDVSLALVAPAVTAAFALAASSG